MEVLVTVSVLSFGIFSANYCYGVLLRRLGDDRAVVETVVAATSLVENVLENPPLCADTSYSVMVNSQCSLFVKMVPLPGNRNLTFVDVAPAVRLPSGRSADLSLLRRIVYCKQKKALR